MDIRIALVGYGEAGSAFAGAADWKTRAGVWDVREERLLCANEAGLDAAPHACAALADARLVLSLVTADQALGAARDYAPHLMQGAIWCDMNSLAPQTKREAATLIEQAGGRYVDGAVLAPVLPARLAVPILLSGKAAIEAQTLLSACGFRNLRIVGDEVGHASAIKMIRSVMVKGIEALTAEMMLAAHAAGVTAEVLASLDASEKTPSGSVPSWSHRAAYHLERMVSHGSRRAAEMEECVQTLRALGITPIMTEGTVHRQREMAGRKEWFTDKKGTGA